ncbi:MAG: primosomal protein N' [Oscillospiraceae bacterium]|nr:primosomal protein N' [Oscillospiraceae bacterium]
MISEPQYASVAVEGAAYTYDKLFDYLIPTRLRGEVLRGCRVMVTFGAQKKPRIGVVMRVHHNPPRVAAKPILQLIDDAPLIDELFCELILWMKSNTFCTFYDAFCAAVPPGLRYRAEQTYCAMPSGETPPIEMLTPDELFLLDVLRKTRSKDSFIKRGALLKKAGFPADSPIPDALTERGYLITGSAALRASGEKLERMAALTEEIENASDRALTPKQKLVVDFLRENGAASCKEICEFTGVSPGIPRSLEQKGLVFFFDQPKVLQSPPGAEHTRGKAEKIRLTQEQCKAYQNLSAAMRAEKPKTALLFGVTGSGKTQVYLRLIDDVLASGKTAVVMVPEIALTSQLLEIFTARYGDQIALFHSAMPIAARLAHWRRVKDGAASIALGTRSAIFAPLQNLGLIIMDEEHEHTYKSEQSPRFHTRDIAKFRAGYDNAMLLLGSATPSVESYAAALAGRYQLETLQTRYANAELPAVQTVDLLDEHARGNKTLLSETLVERLRETLEAKKQAILLINRRGYNTFLACEACKEVVTCPQCSISLAYHLAKDCVKCHYCGFTAARPRVCPHCGKQTVRFGGVGTQKIVEQLAAHVPSARIARLDADVSALVGARETVLRQFADGVYDILVGTQMVAKGFDFENVTLVGVVSVDQQLYFDDFRSLERTFALLTQVVGRAGRGKFKGTAVVQTIAPQNEIIQLAAKQDYPAFFDEEIRIRKAMVYPPYCDLCMLAVVSAGEVHARTGAKQLLQAIELLAKDEYADQKIIVLGPTAARVKKLNNKFRWRLLIKCKNTPRLREMIARLLVDFGKDSRFSEAHAYADMNPANIL